MSPRRAFATAVVVAFIPSFIFVVGVDRYSTHLCEQIGVKAELTERKKEAFSFNFSCISFTFAHYMVWFRSCYS